MKIISKFHDYYDIGLAYGQDPKLLYIRKTANLLSDFLTNDKDFRTAAIKTYTTYSTHKDKKFETLKTVRSIAVIFCGVLYVGFRIHNSEKVYWSHKAIAKAVKLSLDRKLIKLWEDNSKKKGWRKYFYKNDFCSEKVEKFFEKVKDYNDQNKQKLINVCRETDTPIILVKEHQAKTKEGKRYYTRVLKIIKDPNLKDIQFTSVVDSYTAFQELSMFISNYIGIKENPTIEIEDKYKITEHGYNENSFRHPVRTKDL